jgi:hypothetical protein
MATPTKWGSEFLVNTITDDVQMNPAAAGLADGRFVTTWLDYSGTLGDSSWAIHGQIFNADGTKAGAEFRVNTTADGNQAEPTAIGLSDGRFVVMWDSPDSSGNAAIFGQILNVDGTKLGNEFIVTAGATSDVEIGGTKITALDDGRFVAAWSWDLDSVNGSGEVLAQVFNSDGSKFGTEFVVNTFTLNDQYGPSITALSNSGGQFVATWSTVDAAQQHSAIHGQIFNSDGSKWSPEFLVSTANATYESGAQVTPLANGAFVVAWNHAATLDVHAQVFNSNGAKSGAEFLVNTTTVDQQAWPVLAALPDGRFVAAWVDSSETGADSSTTAVRAQVFNANGTKSGAEFLVNTTTDFLQQDPTITVLEDGRFVIGWSDASETGGDQSHSAVRAQIFDPRESAVHLTGTDLNNDWVGTQFNDTMKGGGGDDHLLGGAGADALNGGDGIDTASYATSASAVAVNLATGIGAYGDAQGDTLTGIENLVGSAKNDTLIGDAGNNVIYGGGGGNAIDGGPGDDTAVTWMNFGGGGYLLDAGSVILAGYGESMDALSGIEHIKFADGTVMDLVDDGNPLFDTPYYLMTNPDVFFAGVNALDHFNTTGWHEGRDPNLWFDTSGYLATNKDVAAAGINPLEHYHQSGWHEGRDPSAYFDTTLYLINNPDVAAAGIDPLLHYLKWGLSEGRWTYDAIGTAVNGFDAEYYLFHNPDVAAAGVDPLWHYNTFGWHEGRDPNAWFDTAGYLAHNPDVAAANINPLQHYETVGWTEGRDPSAGFDTLKYLAANPDVAAAHVNPLDHFINHGIYEGRTAIADLVWN